MRCRSRVGSFLAAAILLAPCTARAQRDVFLRGVAQLTAAVAAPDLDKPSAKSSAVDTMSAGLAEWDRVIRELRVRVSDVKDGPAERAFEAQKSLGLAYLERGRFGDALEAFDAAEAISASCPADLHVLRATALEALTQPVAAAQAYLDAWRCAPADAARAYDVLRYRFGTPEEIGAARSTLLDALRRLVEGQAPSPTPFVTPGAIPDNLAKSPVLADGGTQAAYALLARHEYDEALAALTRAADGSSSASRDSALERFTRARAHEGRNEIPDARREYEAAVEGTLVGRHVLHRGIGLLARAEGDFARAGRAFERAVRLSPNDADLHALLAQLYVEQDRLDDAFREVVAALLIDPDHAPAYVLAGQIHLDTGRAADAVAALQKALHLQPANHEPRYALAAALMRVGRFDDAAREREAFERASREALERRRREMAAGVQREQALRDRLADEDRSR